LNEVKNERFAMGVVFVCVCGSLLPNPPKFCEKGISFDTKGLVNKCEEEILIG
jgi:hypothetical protein